MRNAKTNGRRAVVYKAYTVTKSNELEWIGLASPDKANIDVINIKIDEKPVDGFIRLVPTHWE